MCKTIRAIQEGDMKEAWIGLVTMTKDIRSTLQKNSKDIALIKQDIEYVKKDSEDIKSGKLMPIFCQSHSREVSKALEAFDVRLAVMEEKVNGLKSVNKFIADNWYSILKGVGLVVVGGFLVFGLTSGTITTAEIQQIVTK